jgi:hypothetical protein
MDFPEKIFIYEECGDTIYTLKAANGYVGCGYKEYLQNDRYSYAMSITTDSKLVWQGGISYKWYESLEECLKYREEVIKEQIYALEEELVNLKESLNSTVEVR